MTKIIPNGVEIKNVVAESGREYEVTLKNAGKFTGFMNVKTDGSNKALLKVLLDLDGANVHKKVIHEEEFNIKYQKDFIRVVDSIIKDYEEKVYYDSYKKFLDWDGEI